MIELYSSSQFWISLGQIAAVNLVLSGDNALVIAIFARSMPPERQKQAIFWGSFAAVAIRLTLTIAAFEILRLPYMKIVGGALLLRIAGQLLLTNTDDDEIHGGPAPVVASTIYVIMLANLAMSLDNVLGVAAAAANNVLILALGLFISALIIGFAASRVIEITARFPAVYPLSAALIGYLAGDMLVGDTAIKDWIDAHLHWLQSVTVGPLAFSVAGLIGSASVFMLAWTSRHLMRRRGDRQGEKISHGPLLGFVRNFGGHMRRRLAGYRLLTLLPYAIVIAVIYLGHPLYVYHKNWLLKQIRYHGLSLGMTPDEIIRGKGYPASVVEDLPDGAGQRIVEIGAMPKSKAVTDYQQWEFHLGRNAQASLDVVFSKNTMEVTQIGCYSERGYCPPAAGISTGASEDEVIEKLGRPRTVRSSKMIETFDYPELHLSISFADKRVVMLAIHNFESAALREKTGASQH